MKKAKIKLLIKAARKSAQDSMALTIINNIQEYTTQFGWESKKLNKQIKKGANQLAKKIAKEIKIDKASLSAPANEVHAVGLSDSSPA